VNNPSLCRNLLQSIILILLLEHMMNITNKVQIRFYNGALEAVNKHKNSMPLETLFEQNLISQMKNYKIHKETNSIL
jgi:hypothetical protein